MNESPEMMHTVEAQEGGFETRGAKMERAHGFVADEYRKGVAELMSRGLEVGK